MRSRRISVGEVLSDSETRHQHGTSIIKFLSVKIRLTLLAVPSIFACEGPPAFNALYLCSGLIVSFTVYLSNSRLFCSSRCTTGPIFVQFSFVSSVDPNGALSYSPKLPFIFWSGCLKAFGDGLYGGEAVEWNFGDCKTGRV